MVWVALTGTSIAFGAENFSFYFPSRHETLPLREINQGIYLPLKETLRLFGKLDNEHDRKQWASWQLNKQKLEVQADEPLVKVGQKRIELAFPVRYLDGKWWVPTSFLTEILTEIIPDSLEYHDGTRRVFIGDIEPNSFEVQFESFPGHARLILQFLQQTSVSTAEEKEGWTLYLGTRPLQPPKQQFKFSSPIIKSLTFDDEDGRPKLILIPSHNQMTLQPLITEGGKILILDVSQLGLAQNTQKKSSGFLKSIVPDPTEACDPIIKAGFAPIIVLDPGHGGSDTGIQEHSLLTEKDWTWKLTYQLRLSLIATGKFNVVMTRIGDQLRSIDQRAITANTSQGTAFISFHLSNSRPGKQVVIPYLYQPPLNSTKLDTPEEPSFVSWGEVQNSHLPESLKLAQYLKNEFVQIANIEAREPTLAPVRLLQSVNSPAVLIEISNVNSLENRKGNENSKFILQLAQAITRAIKKFSCKSLSNQ